MRVKNTAPFWKLREEHFERLGQTGALYFLVHPGEGERTRLKNAFLDHPFLSKITEVKTYDKIETLFSDLEWVPLLSERTLYILEGVSKLKKEHVEHLAKKERSFQGAILFLLAEVPPLQVFSLLDQKSLCLDLSEEKSWEKKKRIEEEIILEIQSKKLIFASDALSLFLETLAPEYIGWQEEVEKLSLYKGVNGKVTIADLSALFAPVQEIQFLQGKAQEFLKTGAFEVDASFEETGRWLQWIGALRSSIEMGIGFFNGGAPSKGRYGAGFYESVLKGWTMQALERAWLEVFDFERRLKGFVASPYILWQRTLAKIDFLRFAP